MRIGYWRLGLGVVWLLIAAGLFLRESLLPDDLLARFQSRSLAFGAWFALALAAWNLARWYQEKSARPVVATRPPLAPRGDPAGYEYNPELDFQKMERDDGERQTP